MSYERMMGMGLAITSDPCSGSNAGISVSNGLRRCVTQMDVFDDENGELTQGCFDTGDICRDEAQGRDGDAWCCPAPAGYSPATPATPSASSETATPATEKQTWWTGDIEGMLSTFASKMGIGEQTSSEAQNAAREAGAGASGPTSIRDVAPRVADAPTVQVEDTDATPWYIQYAPHMVIGGLGAGALITLVLVMRNR